MAKQGNKQIAVLISGRGSNMISLCKGVAGGTIPNADVGVVISDKHTAGGLALAAERGIATTVIERRGRSRDKHEREILETLMKLEIDVVCLAGYMRLLSKCFIETFPGQILNIHPSLLPAFSGLDAQRQALEHGVKWTGCTVHFVDDSLDGGPIIAQRVVPVLDGDTIESLSTRILEQEHVLYPEAVKVVIEGRYEILGRRVITPLLK
ncbi:MAG: phosphoribosylglycinamide formyltransferase [Pyrinomonadaceae bacterium]